MTHTLEIARRALTGLLAGALSFALLLWALSATPTQARKSHPSRSQVHKSAAIKPAKAHKVHKASRGANKVKAHKTRQRVHGRGKARRPATVHVSYYHRKFEGRQTASGQVYRADELTAAHRTLPFGTLVRLTEPVSGRQVVVRINDRGPYARHRGLDVSEAAARTLGLMAMGHGRLQMHVLPAGAQEEATEGDPTPDAPVSEAASEALAQGMWHGLFADH